MFCNNCGQKIDDGAVFCPNCGYKQTESGAAPPQSPAYEVSPAPMINPPPQTQPTGAYPIAKPKRHHGCLTAFIIFIVILLLAAAAVYFFVPGLHKPSDLGVKSSMDAYTSAMAKLGITKDESPAGGTADNYTITYGAPHAVDTGLTSEEITSFFDENRPPYYAVKNVQVRVNDDGSIEAAGNLDTNYVFSEILNRQYTKQDAQKELPMLGLIPNTVNVYLKVSGSVENNQLKNFNIETVKIMGVTIPQSLITPNYSFIANTLNSYIAREFTKAGANIDHAGISDGKLDIRGSIPSSVTRTPAQ